MDDTWRVALYYPLGVLPSLFFFSRLMIQWICSEKEGKSVVGKDFWRLSLAGNILLALHYTIQVQYPFALLQAFNGFISWRNLGFIDNRPEGRFNVVTLLGFVFLIVTGLFLIQGYLIIGEVDWIRTPTKPSDLQRVYHATWIHVFGVLGSLVFASRFWVQWWFAEREKKSELSENFWILSLIGSAMMVIYSVVIGDFISIYYYLFGFIPYIRNLVLIKRSAIKS